MKTISKYISALSLALLFVGCTTDLGEQAVYDTEDATPAVLDAIDDSYVLNVDTPYVTAITFTWSEPDFGYSSSATNNLVFDLEGKEFAGASTLTSINLGGEYAVTHETLNSAIMKLLDSYGMEYEAATLEFRIVSSISDSATPLYSNTISSTITPYSGTKQYPSIPLRGDYNGWDYDNSQKLYSANEDDTYEGMIYFNGTAANGWKLCEDSGWANNWGLSGGETDEQSSFTMSPGGDNISIYSLNSYYFTFNYSTLELTMSKPHSSWGIVGSQNDWGGSADTDMTLINTDNTFYLKAVVEFSAGDEWKIRPDNTWSDDIGCSAVKVDSEYSTEGGNFTMPAAGTYTILWYFNAVEQVVEIIAGEVEDPTVDEPTVDEPSGDYENITLRGDYNGWDYTLAQRIYPTSGSKYGAWIHLDGKGANGWKLCSDSDWTTSWGLPSDSEEAETTPLVLVENSQTNINIYTSNIYYAEFELDTETLNMYSASSTWGLAGSKNSWGDTGEADIDMTLANDGSQYYMTATTDFEAGNEFKIRADNSWNYIIGCDDVDVDDSYKTTYTNFTLPETGTYTINWYFNSPTQEVTITKE